MESEVTISIFEITGTAHCISQSDGQRVCDRISGFLDGGINIVLSFKNISTLTPAFLNVAIGQLYGIFREEIVSNLLEIKDVQDDDLPLLMRVVENAKHYFE